MSLSVIGEAGISANGFDLGDLLRVELSHWEAQSTGVASLLARIHGFVVIEWSVPWDFLCANRPKHWCSRSSNPSGSFITDAF